MTQVAIVYHSGYGHTAVQAEAVARGARDVAGVTVSVIKTDDADKNWDLLARADAIIFGCPTYMGGPSAAFKTFADASSKVWFQLGWKDKLAAGFTNSASWSGDKQNTLNGLWTLAMQHGMVWVGLGLMPGYNSTKGAITDINRLGFFAGAAAQSNADAGPDTAPPQADQDTAALLGKRVAEAALRWRKGQG